MTNTADDTVRLEAFFRRQSPHGDALRVTHVEPLTGGWSRSMTRVWVEDGGGRRGYVVRSDPPPGESILCTDRAAEWALLRALGEAGTIPMPRAVWFDATGEDLGSPSIVIEMVDGETLLSLARRSDPDTHLALAAPMCDVAKAIHTFDIARLPPHIEVPTSWADYIGSRIQLWIDGDRARDDPQPFMRLIATWLEANRPKPAPLGLVHGDFHPANILVDQDGSYRMVDWELAHIGDPREDLGWMALAAITQPPDLIAADPDAFYTRYRELTGLSAEQVNPATLAYFLVLAATTVFLPVTEPLAAAARGETTAIRAVYMSNAMAGMHNVLFNTMLSHDRLLSRSAT